MRKPYWRRIIYYNEDDKEDMDLFEDLILLDKELEKLKLKNNEHRFSATIKWMIRSYNKKRAPVLPLKETPKEVTK